MANKLHPGAFNCYAAALPDEHIFTLLARDPAGPATVRFWIKERERLGKIAGPDDEARLNTAWEVAAAMEKWRKDNEDPTGDGPTWRLPRPADLDDDPRIATSGSGKLIESPPKTPEELLDGLLGLLHDLNGYGTNAEMDSEQGNFALEAMLQYAGRLETLTRSLSNLLGAPVATSGYAETRPAPPPVAEHDPVVDTEPDDLAHAPEVPPHRFSTFTKGTRYAYARGLEVSPTHLTKALDEMARDGWLLHSIFGKTDSQNIGFIFERYIPSALEMAHGFIDNPDSTNDMNWAVEEFLSGKPLEDILASHGGLDRE